jgi:hypothetical protein
MEPKGSLPRSQELSTCTCPEPDLSTFLSDPLKKKIQNLPTCKKKVVTCVLGSWRPPAVRISPTKNNNRQRKILQNKKIPGSHEMKETRAINR